jgi:uncharacterized damage-inducible protein DinB
MLTLEFARARLAANGAAIAALTQNVSAEQARWRPAPAAWSLLEVLCHLYDEEREDFRMRVDLTLHRPQADWPPINPAGWVTERGYNQRDLAAASEAFAQERAASLRWLDGLPHPNWDSAHPHPQLGSATAGEMLAAWVAHDHLHLRQLNELHWQWLARSAPPGALEYAGGW